MNLGLEKKALVNEKNRWGNTPLNVAALMGQTNKCKQLLEKEALPNIPNNKGITPLHSCTILEIGELLMDHKADVHAKDEDGYTPLHRAVLNNSPELCTLFIARGADVNAGDFKYISPVYLDANNLNAGALVYITPLDLARRKGHKEVAELLKKHGANESL